MLGVSTISSIGFPVGSIRRDKRVYDSGCVSSEWFEGEGLERTKPGPFASSAKSKTSPLEQPT